MPTNPNNVCLVRSDQISRSGLLGLVNRYRVVLVRITNRQHIGMFELPTHAGGEAADFVICVSLTRQGGGEEMSARIASLLSSRVFSGGKNADKFAAVLSHSYYRTIVAALKGTVALPANWVETHFSAAQDV